MIVRQGDPEAHRWYLVADGELVVEVDRFVVGELGRGGQFGERGLLRGVPRAATVRAVTDVELYGLERDDFLAAVAGVDLERPRSSAARRHRTVAVDAESALVRAPLLHSLGRDAVSELMQRSRVQTVEPGVAIVTDGDHDDTYHVLLSGRAHVVADGSTRAELLPGDAFGEIAVLHRVPRTAKRDRPRALERADRRWRRDSHSGPRPRRRCRRGACRMTRRRLPAHYSGRTLSAGDVAASCERHPYDLAAPDSDKENEQMSFVERSDELYRLIAQGRPRLNLAPGEVIFGQGEPGDRMFIVLAGAVALKAGDDTVETVTAPGLFGEMALIDDIRGHSALSPPTISSSSRSQ